jgi:hypothetical protein
MENIEINYRNVIIDDLLEKYKLDFFKRYEELKVHYLDFLNIEKNKIISILKNQREISKNGLLEYLDENGDTAEFFKLCGKHTIQILEDYKNKILQEKNVDSDTIYDISTDILEDYGLMEYTDENLETEDFLIEYLKTYTYSFFFPDYEISKHRIYNFIENEILITTKDIKNKSESEIENIEFDFSENNDKVKLIILEKLGVIDYIKSIQQKPEIISHTAQILSAFTGIKSDNLYSYLHPMISPIRDDNNKNSPYKNTDNLLKANKQIDNLKINNTNK